MSPSMFEILGVEFGHALCEDATVNDVAHPGHHPVQRRKSWQLTPLMAELLDSYVDEIRRVVHHLRRLVHPANRNLGAALDLMREIGAVCRQRGLKPPNFRSVKRRLNSLDLSLVMKERMGGKAAASVFKPIGVRSSNPPLLRMDLVQIDHTLGGFHCEIRFRSTSIEAIIAGGAVNDRLQPKQKLRLCLWICGFRNGTPIFIPREIHQGKDNLLLVPPTSPAPTTRRSVHCYELLRGLILCTCGLII